MSDAKDWRGTPIVEGATVIYGAPVGRSIALVEATVEGFTKSGRVWLRVVRRAYGGGWAEYKPVVHVGADRLTVVDALPPCDMPTEADKAEADRVQKVARWRERIAELRGGAVPRWEWETVEQLEKWLAELGEAA